jgi:hypothetical protein
MRRDIKIVCPAYEDYIKAQCCMVRRPPQCLGDVTWHHVVARGQRQSKRNDFLTVPLCARHHAEIEQVGIEKFQRTHDLNVWKEIAWYLVAFIVEHGLVSMVLGKR